MLRDPLRDPLALSILSSEKIRRIQNFSGLRAPKKAPESKTLWSTSMNERIKDLAIKTDIWCDENIFNSYAYNAAWEEKFAELIISECIDTVNKRYMGDNNREDMEVKRCVQALKDRFGIEQ